MPRTRSTSSAEPQGGSPPARTAGADGPHFSVVIPAYNEARFIGDCLDSLSRQDFTGGYEVIVVDNNSSDRTSEIARAGGATVVWEEHAGVCRARQRGTLAARGEIVVSTDADTRFDPAWLSRIDQAFGEDSSRVAVAGPCRYLDGPWWGRLYARLLFEFVHLVNRMTGMVVYVTATNIAFRKSHWSGYDTWSTQGGDELDLLHQLRSRGRVAFEPRNPTFTSARRLNQGLAYNLVVSCFFYYFLAHGLNRLFARTVIGTAPAFRSTGRPKPLVQRVEHLLAGTGLAALCGGLGILMTHLVAAR
jgi:glycosyltransferase involved in cell wall biosynthesis